MCREPAPGIWSLLAAALLALAAAGCSDGAPPDVAAPPPSDLTAGWPEYAAAAGGGHYSPLAQITPANVAKLEVAWTYHTGDLRQPSERWPQSSFQVTPILWDDLLLFCTPFNRVVALDAETGQERRLV